MLEVRFHGRGGQGAVLAAELLAQAAFIGGKFPQSFPFFGVERRGAPVAAYCRIGDSPIGVRTAITSPDIVVVLERGLLRSVSVTDGLHQGGRILVNAPSTVRDIPVPPGVQVATVDASRIARGLGLGTPTLPIVNTAVLGALVRLTGVVPLEALDRAIESFVPRQRAQNHAAALAGSQEVGILEGPFPAPAVHPFVEPSALPEGPLATTPSEVLHTSSWRTMTPVIHTDHCTRCNFCWKFCPDDAFGFDEKGYPVVRTEYCKGCGICAVECPPRVIEMVEEA